MRTAHRILSLVSAVLAVLAVVYAVIMAVVSWAVMSRYGWGGGAWMFALLAARPGLVMAPVLAMGAWAFHRGVAGWG